MAKTRSGSSTAIIGYTWRALFRPCPISNWKWFWVTINIRFHFVVWVDLLLLAVLIRLIPLSLGFLLGFELRQCLQVLAPEHGLIGIELKGGWLSNCCDYLGRLAHTHFLDLVAVEEAFDVHEMISGIATQLTCPLTPDRKRTRQSASCHRSGSTPADGSTLCCWSLFM